ncbi:MAG: 2-dehydropantoate 2-reductase [Chloroflexota bacterium]|nr:2-dehydropantoate 2-reductase [Chloroflexota bacterium]
MEAQRVAVIGAGAVGSYYGARLAQAGHDVHFLLRRDYEAVRAAGLRCTSPLGDFALDAPSIARTAEEIGPADWVVCALKSTSIGEARALVEPCVGPRTRILLLMNGLGLEERFAEWFGRERIFGGMAFTCVNRGEPGCVHHLAYGAVTVGHLLDDAAEVARALALWAPARVEFSGVESLRRARWEKLCWNIPFNGLCVAAGGVMTDVVVGDPALRAIARATMEEVVVAGNADLEARGEALRLDGSAIVETMFALTDNMGPYRPSTMIDYVEGRQMEVPAIFGAPLARAQELGVETPHLATLTALLQQYARNRRGAPA